MKLKIWDTAGQEKFRTICETYYRGSHGIVMVFDVTNRESFESIEMWLREAKLHGDESAVRMLVGSKTDKEGRVVQREEAQSLASKLKIKYMETSAQSGAGIEDAFVELATEIFKLQGGGSQRRPSIILGEADALDGSEDTVQIGGHKKDKCC